MDESIEKSTSEDNSAIVTELPKIMSEKGKRATEDSIENEVLNTKKQKVEDHTVKTGIEVDTSAKSGLVGLDSDDKGCCLNEDKSAAEKEPAVTAKNGQTAASEKKGEVGDNSDSSSKDGTSADFVTEKVYISSTEEDPVAAAKKTDGSSENSDYFSQDQISMDVDAAPNEAPTAPSAKIQAVSMQNNVETSSFMFECDNHTSTGKEVATSEKAPAAHADEDVVMTTEKINELNNDGEIICEDDVTDKNTSAAVTEKKNESNGEPKLDNEAKSSDKDHQVHVPPREQFTGNKTLFVGNLSFAIYREDVEEFFKDAGEIVKIRFGMNRDESFRGFGYVEFAKAEDAAKALNELNGKELLRREVRLDYERRRQIYAPDNGSRDNRSFQEGGRAQGPRNFGHRCNKFDGKDQIGSSMGDHSGSSGDFNRAFVQKYQYGAVEGARDTESFQRGGRPEEPRIFIRGVNIFDSEDKIRSSLKDHFGPCGEITKIKIPIDHDGAIKGISLISFKDSDAYKRALLLDGSELEGSILTVKEARPPDDRGRGWRGGGWDYGGRSGYRNERWDSGGRSGYRNERWDSGGRSGGRNMRWDSSGRSGGRDFGGTSGWSRGWDSGGRSDWRSGGWDSRGRSRGCDYRGRSRGCNYGASSSRDFGWSANHSSGGWVGGGGGGH